VNNFNQRTITGIVILILVVGSIKLGPVVFAILFFAVTILGILELCKILESDSFLIDKSRVVVVVVGSLLYMIIALISLNIISIKYLLISLPLVFSLFILELYANRTKPFVNIAFSLICILYIAVPFSLLNLLFYPDFDFQDSNKGLLIGFFCITWTYDTMAYLSGLWLGKHKLFERISPKKTWQGTIGGLIFALLMAYAVYSYFGIYSVSTWFILAVIIVVFGTMGDLVESLLKRSMKIKDSGNILPGHGGILDRFDSVLISAPFVFVYLLLIN